jgi:hypothetical protein
MPPQIGPQVTPLAPHVAWLHPQLPSMQSWPAGHALPHLPQLFGSLRNAEHPPEQQRSPAAQTFPHVPQLWVSDCGSVQPSGHEVSPSQQPFAQVAGKIVMPTTMGGHT